MTSYDHVYISPHYDDAAFSCGGAIHRESRQGQRVLVATLLGAAASPAARPSRLARELHARMDDPEALIAQRRAEDLACMEILGATALALPFPDAIYRGDGQGAWHYTSIAALFGPLHPADMRLAQDMADELIRQVAGSGRPVFHAPLGVGRHVDHRLANQVGWLLAERGWRVIFYEDFPYAEPGYTQPALGPTGHPVSAAVAGQRGALCPHDGELSDEDLAHHIRGACAYTSQLALVFGDPATVGARIRVHAERHRPGALIARVWQPCAP